MKRTLEDDLEQYKTLKIKSANALHGDNIESALDYIFIAATFAWNVPLGFWYDIELENLLTDVSKSIKRKRRLKNNLGVSEEKNGKRVAHVVSFLSDLGGHSRIVRQWMDMLNDIVDKQDLYITDVSPEPTVFGHRSYYQRKGIKIQQLLFTERYEQRILKLADYFEQEIPDFFILYINPNDVIAIAALQLLQKKPYVVFVNHADHVFWLGRTIVDKLVEFRLVSQQYSQEFRSISNTSCIPLTTNIIPKQISKTFYGIPESTTVSLSVGYDSKIVGDPNWNYFKTIETILNKFPSHYHLLVTTMSKRVRQQVSEIQHIGKRFIILDSIPNLESIYGCADFLIETFPISGGTVQVEAMACKLPIVGVRNKKFNLFTDADTLPPKYPYIASTENEVIDYSSEFINHSHVRQQVGQQLYEYYKEKMSPSIIRTLLQRLLAGELSIETSSIQHASLDFNYAYQVFPRFFIQRYILSHLLSKPTDFSTNEKISCFLVGMKNKEFDGKESIEGLFSLFGFAVSQKIYRFIVSH